MPDATEDVDEDAPELPPADLPDDVLIYTLPSRYCLPDMLGDEAWSRFGGMPTGYRRVQAICDHVNKHLEFRYGSTTATSTAADVNTSGFGVCRDFTHLAISFCRSLNIPARYVFGYLPDIEVEPAPEPMDFAAWMEVWLGGRWWTFDPRNNRRRKGRIVIGRGRDASDVAMATTFGAPVLESMVVIAEEVPRMTFDDTPLLDHDELDLESAERITYRIEQGFRYDYDAPVESVRQRLVVVPPDRHGDLHRRAHRVAVTGATSRRQVHRDAAGNTIVRIHAARVESSVEFRVAAIVERVRGDGPPTLPVAALTDPRLLRHTRLTAPDDQLRELAESLTSRRGRPRPGDCDLRGRPHGGDVRVRRDHRRDDGRAGPRRRAWRLPGLRAPDARAVPPRRAARPVRVRPPARPGRHARLGRGARPRTATPRWRCRSTRATAAAPTPGT